MATVEEYWLFPGIDLCSSRPASLLHIISFTFCPLSIVHVFVMSGNRLSEQKLRKKYLWWDTHTEELRVEFIFMSHRHVSRCSNPGKLLLRRNYQQQE